MSADDQESRKVPKKKEWTRRNRSGRMSTTQRRKRERVLNKSKRLEVLTRVPTSIQEIERQLPYVNDRIYENFSYRLQSIIESAFQVHNISCADGMKILATLHSGEAVLKQWESERKEALQDAQEMTSEDDLDCSATNMDETIVKQGKKKKSQKKEKEKEKEKEKDKEKDKQTEKEKEKETEADKGNNTAKKPRMLIVRVKYPSNNTR